MKNLKEYPIKAVSLRTGLSIHVIRAWEKRYQTVVPNRTDTNRRLYSEQDIDKLILLKSCIEGGQNIGNIASLSIAELQQLIKPNQETKGANNIVLHENDAVKVKDYVENSVQAVRDFNPEALKKILFDASLQLSQPVFLEAVIVKLITKVGELWHGGEIRIMHEHMATVILKNFLSNMRSNYRAAENAHHIIVATPVGQIHELGAMILSLVAAADGWNVTYLGPNLPAEEIVMAATEKNAKAVLLSIVYPAADLFLKNDLIKLKKILPKHIAIVVGGRMAESYKAELELIKAEVISDLDGFKKLSSIIMNQL